ncbi:MAG TPA: LLM class flavin-dependent oxidoreductase [Dehalococcoidia bacterium]|nr:LLM class flavin-dependent oxidoreductase [Dehalococcoidia bacterium]
MTSLGHVPFSVLDLANVPDGSDVGTALKNSIDLARHVEALGYQRFWVAEHHNMPGIASSAPGVLIAHVADATSSIRVGSGGVMLPNHAPLVVAEQFGMLEALHPGRIDLGIGRAPGTDPVTAHALRRDTDPLSAEDFPQQLGELLAFFSGRFPEGHPYRRITAVPGLGNEPAIWLLGSSDFSAQLAGWLGLPFSFAHHFSARNTMPALGAYRSNFHPSETLARPHAMVAVAVICAETDERAEWLAGSSTLSFVRLRTGTPGRLPTPEEAATHVYSPTEQLVLQTRSAGLIVGGPAKVREELSRLLEETDADELMITTTVHSHEERLRSYELVADIAQVRDAPRTAVGPR